MRLVSLADRAIGVQLIELSVDQPAEITVEALMEDAGSGLEVVRVEPELAVWRTAEPAKSLAVASITELHRNGTRLVPDIQSTLQSRWAWSAVPGQAVTFWRLTAFARSHNDGQEVEGEVRSTLDRAQRVGWRGVLDGHAAAWAERWRGSVLHHRRRAGAQRRAALRRLPPDRRRQPRRRARLHRRARAHRRGVPGPRLLGHRDLHAAVLHPHLARGRARAALYRHHTLPGARARRSRLGYRGALFAWESADTGDEATPALVLGPAARCSQCSPASRSSTSAPTSPTPSGVLAGDGRRAFLLDAGAEILSRPRASGPAGPSGTDGRFHIRGVIGPDEYHEGVDDNAYTNGMAGWNLERGRRDGGAPCGAGRNRWQALSARLALTDSEMRQWGGCRQSHGHRFPSPERTHCSRPLWPKKVLRRSSALRGAPHG